MGKQAIVVVLTVIGAAFCWSAPHQMFQRALAQETARVPQPLPVPSDGSFSLVDHRGRNVTDTDFRGNYLLVYFGYTYCPDVCPTGLQMMSEAVELLGTAATKVQPIFITVDPERDTPEVLLDYVGAFHPRLVGLTGTPKQIRAVAEGYSVRYFKFYPPPSWDDDEEMGENDEKGVEYVMSHTASTYLLDPDGRGLATFPHGAWPKDMAPRIRRFIEDEAGE